MSFHTIEDMIGAGATGAVGNPSYLAILVMGFFTGFVIVQNQRGDVKALGIMGALILSSLFAPIFAILAMFVFAGLLLFAVMKIMNR